jgi:hypothetical protein
LGVEGNSKNSYPVKVFLPPSSGVSATNSGFGLTRAIPEFSR